MHNTVRYGLGAALAMSVSATALFADTVKIAFIDPLSGPFAATGTNGLNQFQFAAETLVNDKGGVLDGDTFEVLGFDNKISPKESLIQLQVAIDQGVRYVVQGNSSGVANALTDAIDKHNRRNPDSQVLFLNYSAVDPALTNEKCNFWHFRFDGHADMKMDALTDVIAQDDSIKKVYVIGQDYSFGKAVGSAAQSMLAEKRPDIEIVGNELHPIGKVKDFTPYARKIQASEADAVITGNWGADMYGLGKSILDNGFEGPIYTYYAAADGMTAAFGEAGKDSIRLISEGAQNPPPTPQAAEYIEAFKAKYPDGNVSQSRITNTIEMLAKAIEEAGTATDVQKVAAALEGMEHETMWGGTVYMRPEDHQAIQNMHVFVHTNDDITYDYDNSGYGMLTESTIENAGADTPTTCDMKRPS
ncbi:branched-chain amino acid ABC transporter substrate-binding protein [Chachezhania antarctica]|uniref:branched-chain amino acid ABC transporter substrate-binding protein n=1 Tax=Chachezhania antarctica TaxID=2340860 RepID=UPI000EB270FF|nr:branched-chain amino acid ABC transporter substrate-binding protein [Chachezhania antarctica]